MSRIQVYLRNSWKLKPNMVKVGDVRTFENFIVSVPDTIDPTNFNTVIVWCESFDEFITSASYMSS